VEVPSPTSDRSGAAVAGGTDGLEADGGTCSIPFRGYLVVLSSPYRDGFRAPTGLTYQLLQRGLTSTYSRSIRSRGSI